MSLPTLESERLVLRPFDAEADAAAVERLAGDFAIADATLTVPHPYPAGAGAAWIATHAERWASGSGLTLAIASGENPADVVGAIGVSITAEHRRAELGYWIGVPYWGRGYATEASRALLRFGFVDLALHRIQARHFLRNPASGRVLEKVGMQFEGVMRGSLRKWDRFEDAAMYAALAPEWLA